MNFSGYLLYTIYTSLGYFTKIKGAGTVLLPDLLFVYHAMFMLLLFLIQFIIYPVTLYPYAREAIMYFQAKCWSFPLRCGLSCLGKYLCKEYILSNSGASNRALGRILESCCCYGLCEIGIRAYQVFSTTLLEL